MLILQTLEELMKHLITTEAGSTLIENLKRNSRCMNETSHQRQFFYAIVFARKIVAFYGLLLLTAPNVALLGRSDQ